MHRVARLHVRLDAGHDAVADGEALRRQDVGERAVLILDESQERGAVRIVLEPLHLGRDIVLGAAKINAAVGLLMPAADVAHGDAAVVVAAAGLGLPCVSIFRGRPSQLAAIDTPGGADPASSNGMFSGHCYSASLEPRGYVDGGPPRGSRSRACGALPRADVLEHLHLALAAWVLTAFTFTLNNFSTAALISGLLHCAPPEHNLVVLGDRVDFSVMAERE